MRVCPKCKLNKEDKEFSKNKRAKTGLQVYCKFCRKDIYEKGKEQRKIYDRKHGIELHGITETEYNSAANLYDNKCWLCRKRYDQTRRGLVIDHDHNCKYAANHKKFSHTEYGCRFCVRGLLCYSCNRFVIPFLEKFIPDYPYLLGRPFSKGLK